MPFIIPAFPLTYKGWHYYNPSTSIYAMNDYDGPCNLTPGRRIITNAYNTTLYVGDFATYEMQMELLVPKGAPVCPMDDTGPTDLLEVPKSSGRFYLVTYVDDIGKGFANEHRLVICNRIQQATVFTDETFPVPRPLP